MRRFLWDLLKVLILFIGCTILFYYSIRAIHEEYEQFHRYDHPEGPAVKVFAEKNGFIDRLHLFFRLGE